MKMKKKMFILFKVIKTYPKGIDLPGSLQDRYP